MATRTKKVNDRAKVKTTIAKENLGHRFVILYKGKSGAMLRTARIRAEASPIWCTGLK